MSHSVQRRHLRGQVRLARHDAVYGGDMYSLDESVLVVVLMVSSALIVWWRQMLRLLAGVVVFLVVAGLIMVISTVQYFP